MYKLYLNEYPSNKISYHFWNFYRKNFNYKFGRPQVDTCCKYEKLSLKLKSPYLNEVAKRSAATELLCHKRRSKKLYTLLHNESVKDEYEERNVLSICFDYLPMAYLASCWR